MGWKLQYSPTPYKAPGDKTEFEDRLGDLVDDNSALNSPTWELDRPEADQGFAIPAVPELRVPTPNEAQRFAKIAFTSSTGESDNLEKSGDFTPDETGDASLAALQKRLLDSGDHEAEVETSREKQETIVEVAEKTEIVPEKEEPVERPDEKVEISSETESQGHQTELANQLREVTIHEQSSLQEHEVSKVNTEPENEDISLPIQEKDSFR